MATGHGNLHRVLMSDGELLAAVSGRLRHEAVGSADLPAVGDWVALDPRVAEGRATIHGVLDCRHRGEPGCAVRAAVESGELPEERLRSHDKVAAELHHLEVRSHPDLERAQKARWRAIHRAARKHRPRM